MLGIVLVVHAAVALVVGLAGRRLGRRVLVLAALAPAVGFIVSVGLTGGVLDGTPVTSSLSWVPGMGLSLDLRLDGFGLLMWWIITGIGVLVLLYASRYFGERDDLGRFGALLVTFAGAMLLLTAADDLYALFVAWELTSITSYLLIGFQDDDAEARGSALQALLVTGAGGLALLAGLVLLQQGAGTSSLSAILAAPPSGAAVEVGLVLVLLGAMTKSAQAPFHFWLPGAMAAPTPVSAYLHSATMVKAGIYVLARVAPAFAPEVAWWTPTLVVVGGVTMLLGGWRALRSFDLKELLAFGTVSQLGLIVLLVGHGDPEMVFAGIGVLVAHALFKAALFLSVGVVDHQAHSRDLRRLAGLGRVMPRTAVAATVAAASMAGVIPLLGFVAKESALEAALHQEQGAALLAGLITVGAVLTTAYGLRFVRGAFLGIAEDEVHEDVVDPEQVAAPSLSFELPAIVLAVATVLFGLWVAPVDGLVVGGAGSLDAEASAYHLKLWHGFGTSLLLSTVALVGGALVWRARDPVASVARLTERWPSSIGAYRWSLRSLLAVADRTTAVVQPGSLPIYLGVVLATVVLLPGTALLQGASLEVSRIADSPVQVVVAGAVAASALGATMVRTRLSTVLLLGGVGFGVAVLFVVQGAPDLALTQLLVETLSLGIFVLVLRRLPERFSQPSWRLGTALRLVVAVSVGVFVTAFALVATAARRSPGVADEFLSRAEPEGGGTNVVNVILTDFRALDTLGEVTVIAVAAVGVLAIVRAGRDNDADDADDTDGVAAHGDRDHAVDGAASADGSSGPRSSSSAASDGERTPVPADSEVGQADQEVTS